MNKSEITFGKLAAIALVINGPHDFPEGTPAEYIEAARKKKWVDTPDVERAKATEAALAVCRELL